MLRVLPLSLLLMVVVDTGSAAGFGTVRDSIVLGQNAEHEMITRRALSCTARSSADCFESRSLLSLAGGPGTFGAVGEPDMVPAAPAPAHCDDADYVAGTYSRTRRQATNQLRACWKHLRERFRQASGRRT